MKFQDRITVLLFVLVLAGFSVAFWILPDKVFSEQENRGLQTLPRFSVQRLVSGDYAGEINGYFADQFPLRNTLVSWKGGLEIALGKGENNGILLGRNGCLARRKFDIHTADDRTIRQTDAFDPALITSSMDGILRAGAGLQRPFSVLLTGRNLDVEPSAFSYPPSFSDALLEQIHGSAGEGLAWIDLIPAFRERITAGEYLYYRTDHHWTTRGAYYAYCEVMRSFGMEEDILPETAFEKKIVSERFYGTLWSAGGMNWIRPDSVEFWLLGNEDDWEVTADGKKLEGLYSFDWLNRKDCYSAFLDGTHDIVTVRSKQGKVRPTLLILKDSFANSLAPFLVQHFDLILLNLSSQHMNFTDLTAQAEFYHADAVLLVYTLENVITTDKLSRLH